eukprot:scaffold17220_cov65-Phaeocystis_antarctica.AAC.4
MAIRPMAGWAHEDVLFVDDSIGHIEKARRARRTLLYSLWLHSLWSYLLWLYSLCRQEHLPHTARDGQGRDAGGRARGDIQGCGLAAS